MAIRFYKVVKIVPAYLVNFKPACMINISSACMINFKQALAVNLIIGLLRDGESEGTVGAIHFF